jgi:hypothetical protein
MARNAQRARAFRVSAAPGGDRSTRAPKGLAPRRSVTLAGCAGWLVRRFELRRELMQVRVQSGEKAQDRVPANTAPSALDLGDIRRVDAQTRGELFLGYPTPRAQCGQSLPEVVSSAALVDGVLSCWHVLTVALLVVIRQGNFGQVDHFIRDNEVDVATYDRDRAGSSTCSSRTPPSSPRRYGAGQRLVTQAGPGLAVRRCRSGPMTQPAPRRGAVTCASRAC